MYLIIIIFISKIRQVLHMSDVMWKCFRCDLKFQDKIHANIHKRISGHDVTKIKAVHITF